MASDPGLGNASLLRFIYEIDSSPPAGLLLNTDYSETVAPGSSLSRQASSSSSTVASAFDLRQQANIMPDALLSEALFFYYMPQITLASFLQELNAHRADIVQTTPDCITDMEFKFLNEFLLQV